MKVNKRESGHCESEHIFALAANAFVGGDYLDDLEALLKHSTPVVLQAIKANS